MSRVSNLDDLVAEYHYEEDTSELCEKFAINLTVSDTKTVHTGTFTNVYITEYASEDIQGLIKGKLTVAVKVPNQPGQNKSIMREADILRACSHPNITYLIRVEKTIVDFFVTDCLVFYYYSNSCTLDILFEQIAKTQQGKLVEHEVLIIMKQLFAAVDYIHGRRILHRSLHPNNVLVDYFGRVKMMGFSNALCLKAGEQVKHEVCGETPYQAPEVINGSAYDFPADIYCIGLIFYYLNNMSLPSGEQESAMESDMDKLSAQLLMHEPTSRITANKCRFHNLVASANLIFAEIPSYGRLVAHPDETDMDIYFWLNSRYEIDQAIKLGSGGFSTVYLARGPESKNYAAKVVNLTAMSHATFLNIEEEYQCQQLLDHVSLCKLHERIDYEHQSQKFTCFVVDLVLGIPLERIAFLLKSKSQWFTAAEIRLLAAQLVDVLVYLYSQKIVHRDFKENNVLVDEHGFVKVIDFSFTSRCNEKGHVFGAQGTPGFAAPEITLRHWGCCKSDVFSVGVIFYNLLYFKHPFSYERTEYFNEMQALCHTDPNYAEVAPQFQPMLDLVKSMLQFGVNKRISARRLKKSDFISSVCLKTVRERQEVQQFSRLIPLFEMI